MKEGLAAMTMAVKAVIQSGHRFKGDVILAGTVGEETMDGAVSVPQVIDRGYMADAAIHTEPSDTVQPACGGLLWLKITVEGKSTHSLFRYEMIRAGRRGNVVGVNAIDKAFKIYSALQALDNEWGLTKRYHLLPPGHSTIGANVIRGGPGEIATPFIVPDSCVLDYCIWYPPNLKVEEIKSEIENQIAASTVNDLWLQEHPPRLEWVLHWHPFLTPENHPIVTTVVGAHNQVTGKPPGISSSIAVNDGSFTSLKGMPSLAYGAGGEGLPTAHAVDEFVRIDDLVRVTKVLTVALIDWCG
jgi:acetylornithine deacetylase